MKRHHVVTAVGVLLFGLGLAAPMAAIGGPCIAAKGKIFNNALIDGTTLGTVHLTFGNEKLKCGLRGIKKDGTGQLNFDHTMVCDDDAGSDDPVHSQLLWDTTGYFTSDPESCNNPYAPDLVSFSFTEVSTPVIGTGRFANVTRGQITVDGTFFCTLAIDMEFSGQLCFDDDD